MRSLHSQGRQKFPSELVPIKGLSFSGSTVHKWQRELNWSTGEHLFNGKSLKKDDNEKDPVGFFSRNVKISWIY